MPEHLAYILVHHNKSSGLPYNVQKKKVMEYMSQHTHLQTQEVMWEIFCRPVCQRAWGAFHAVAESTLGKYKAEFLKGVNSDSIFHGNQGKHYRSPQRYFALTNKALSIAIKEK
jgi:hypothetical protein